MLSRARESLRQLVDRGGAAKVAMPIATVVVLAAAGVATWLLVRTAEAANGINDKAAQIARNGRGIDASTDSIRELRRTNRLARSILRSATPLDHKLASTVRLARRIDGTAAAIGRTARGIDATAGHINATAGSIDATAQTIDTTAAGIDSTAGGIETAAAGIVPVSGAIDSDVRLINLNLDRTIGLGRLLVGDTSRVLGEGRAIHQTAACIDRRVGGRSGFDGHCEGQR